jgi:hypothetical protein
MLDFEALPPVAPVPTPAGDGLPVTPIDFPAMARRQAYLLELGGLHFKAARLIRCPDNDEVVGRSQIARKVAAFVHAKSPDAPAHAVVIRCHPQPRWFEIALKALHTTLVLCDAAIDQPAWAALMVTLLDRLKPDGSNTIVFGSLRCGGTWVADQEIALGVTLAKGTK